MKGLTNLFYQPEEKRSPRESSPEPEECSQIGIEEVDTGISLVQGTEDNDGTLSEQQVTAGEFLTSKPVAGEAEAKVAGQASLADASFETAYGGKMLYYPLVNKLYDSILEKAEAVDAKQTGGGKLYGLKQIILTLLFYVLARISNPEKSKSVRRREFGILIGEIAAPCCKTLRSGLNMLTAADFPGFISMELRRKYVRLGYVHLGTFYIDGHFIPYYGKKDVHKGYSTQRRIAMPGHYQNWVNDTRGRPIFFYINNSFVKFTDIIKRAIQDVKKLMEEMGIEERLIVVFDRGAYDSKLFTLLDKMGVGFITWQKGGKEKSLSVLTEELSYTNQKGEMITYKSYKGSITIRKYRSEVEAITVLDENTSKQSTFINNLAYVGIAKTDSYKIQLLDGRWAQENFFKEAKVKIDLDHQMGYQFETDKDGEDFHYDVINPEHSEISEKLEQLHRKQDKLKVKRQELIHRFQNLKKKKDIRTYLKQAGIMRVLGAYQLTRKEINDKAKQISVIPMTVKYGSLQETQKDILKTVRSSVILAIRASAFNIMKRFDEMAAASFKDHRELSKFILSITGTSARITISKDTVYVKLKKLETPAYQRAAEKLIQSLNERQPMTMDVKNRKIVYQF